MKTIHSHTTVQLKPAGVFDTEIRYSQDSLFKCINHEVTTALIWRHQVWKSV